MKLFTQTMLTNLIFAASVLGVSAQTTMNVDTFRNEFNSLSDDLRVIITNDPDCGGCLYMIQQEFEIIEDPNGCGLNDGITYFFNWTKVLGGTSAASVTAHTNTWSHPRYIHYWDETQILGDLFLNTLGLVDPSGTGEYTAWHTILCFEPGLEWDVNEQNPPMPTYWLHKLSEQYNADQALYYTDSLFEAGFNAIACLTSIEDNPLEDKISVNSNGSSQIEFNFKGLSKNALLRITAVDGRTAITYPIRETSGSFQLPSNLATGIYVYSLIEDGQTIGSGKIVLTK